MTSIASPTNKSAQIALAHEQEPPFYQVLPIVLGCISGGLGLFVTYVIANMLSHGALEALTMLVGLFASWVGGVHVAEAVHGALTKRDERRLARFYANEEIIGISPSTIRIWWSVVTEYEIPRSHELAQLSAHFDLFGRLARFDKALAGATPSDQIRLLDRIRDEIIVEVEGVAVHLQAVAEGEVNSRHGYVNLILGEQSYRQLDAS